MKKLFVILLCLSATLLSEAQENPKQKEAGIIFNNLDNFGLTYKIGNNKALWRFNTLFFQWE